MKPTRTQLSAVLMAALASLTMAETPPKPAASKPATKPESAPAPAPTPTPAPPASKSATQAKTATISTGDLREYAALDPARQKLVTKALELTAMGLDYTNASADPALGGMDCSGFVFHVLQTCGLTAAPRQSNEMYRWVWEAGAFRATNSLTMNTWEWQALRPGQLVFWVSSTKDGKSDRDPPVTHVMLYLGHRKSDDAPLLAGASDGRSYQGQRMRGVSVFDFQLPTPGGTSRLIGYGDPPGLGGK